MAAVDANASTSAGPPAFFLCTARTSDSAFEPFTVPADVTRVAVVAAGGSGATGRLTADERAGKGALVRAVVPVKPSERLHVRAGCDANGRSGGAGWGDGGNGGRGDDVGGGGGGGSAVLRVDGFSTDILVVAGGGGGGGGRGGDGGDGSGTNAGNRNESTPLGGRGEDGDHFLGDGYVGDGGGGGGGGARGGRGGSGTGLFNYRGGRGGTGGSSMVAPQAELGSEIVAGGAAWGPGWVTIVPLTPGQPAPRALTFDCRPNSASVYELFTVPAGATQILTVVKGGAGGYASPDRVDERRGGRGAIVQGVLPVASGQQYRAKAGCRGGGRDADGSFNISRPRRGGFGYGNGGYGGDNDGTIDNAGGGGGGSAVLTLNWRALVVAGGGGGAGASNLANKGGIGGDGSLAGEPGGGVAGGAGAARDVIHGGDGDDCSRGPGGGGGAGLRGGLGGAGGCRERSFFERLGSVYDFDREGDPGGSGGGGGSSLQPPEGTTKTLERGPHSDGWVVVVLM